MVPAAERHGLDWITTGPWKCCGTILCFYSWFTPEGWAKMPSARTGKLAMLSLLFMGCCAVAAAADADQKLRAGISLFAPFVMFTAHGPEGAAIDAWNLIAQKLGVESDVRLSDSGEAKGIRAKWFGN